MPGSGNRYGKAKNKTRVTKTRKVQSERAPDTFLPKTTRTPGSKAAPIKSAENRRDLNRGRSFWQKQARSAMDRGDRGATDISRSYTKSYARALRQGRRG